MDLGEDLEEAVPEEDPAEPPRGFSAVHARLMGPAGGQGAAEAAARSAAEIRALLEQYHALEYEDHVGGVATRFRSGSGWQVVLMTPTSRCLGSLALLPQLFLGAYDQASPNVNKILPGLHIFVALCSCGAPVAFGHCQISVVGCSGSCIDYHLPARLQVSGGTEGRLWPHHFRHVAASRQGAESGMLSWFFCVLGIVLPCRLQSSGIIISWKAVVAAYWPWSSSVE